MTVDEYLDKFISFEILSKQPDHFIEQLKYKTIIIPVDSDNKKDYIQANSFLNQFIQQHSIEEYGGSKNDDLIRTSVEAKGVDYPQIVVHGFGKYCLDFFEGYSNIENNYDAHFFFNKLYVAVTRAQEELIIIDSEETLEQFWRPLLNDFANSEWRIEVDIEKDDIVNSICQIKKGNTYLIKPGTRDAELEVAKKEKEQALYQNDTDLMRMAASRFIKLGNHKEYYLCKAEEARIQGNFKLAADYYRKNEVGIEGIELASNTYWESELLMEYTELIDSPKNNEQGLRVIISNLMISNKLTPDEVRKLEANTSSVEKLIRNIEWGEKIFEKLAKFAKNIIDKEQQNLLINLFKSINTLDNRNLNYETGSLQFKRGYYSAAITTWDVIEGIEEDLLYAKARIEAAKQEEKYATAIEWLGNILEKSLEKEIIEKEIIDLYEAHIENIDQSKHALAQLYIAGAYLVQNPVASNLLKVVKNSEWGLSNKRKTLIDYYAILLQSGRLSETSFGFVLERWAKNEALDGVDILGINAKYMTFIQKDTLDYPFTQSDIDAIPLEPLYLEHILSEHIYNITIKNFRKFKDVTIENLDKFNLIVGDNNIGKTSLLEAFLFASDKKEYLKRLSFAYIERKNIHPDKKEVNNFLRMYYSLDQEFLKDFKNQEESHLNLEFIFREGRHTWKYSVSENESNDSDSSYQRLKFKENDYDILKELSIEDALQQPFMPYGKGFGMDLAIIYSNVIAPFITIERHFLKCLDLFIPDVERVRADALKGDIFILLEGAEEDKPLHQFGEGANKLFRILLLLSLHKGKRIMIDEIDAGIHYSRFKEFWKVILEAAEKNNTQIIATTHNEECIEFYTSALKELGESYEKKARVVQCKMVAGKLKIRSYDFKNFNFALERGIEIRGGEDI
jgi:AAA15 family ATPase/GTPase